MTDSGMMECHCVPGHRSTVLTHACQDCGFRDCDYFDGKPVPPCPGPPDVLATLTPPE